MPKASKVYVLPAFQKTSADANQAVLSIQHSFLAGLKNFPLLINVVSSYFVVMLQYSLESLLNPLLFKIEHRIFLELTFTRVQQVLSTVKGTLQTAISVIYKNCAKVTLLFRVSDKEAAVQNSLVQDNSASMGWTQDSNRSLSPSISITLSAEFLIPYFILLPQFFCFLNSYFFCHFYPLKQDFSVLQGLC